MIAFGMARACVLAAIVATAGVFGVGCGDDAKRPLGGSCDSDGQCASGICGASKCLDPAQDDDGDGLTNAVEKALGSDPTLADTDRDGADDGEEVAADQSGVDTDDDGKIDALESRTTDVDKDCIPDQFDAEDDVSNGDLSPLIDVICKDAGPCATQRAALAVECPTGKAVCIYDQVAGYADPEIACDQIDENCDGTTDEGFPVGCVDDDWDDDGFVDSADVCPEVADADQADEDADGVGDACVDRYALAFVAPLPPATIAAGVAFTVHGAIVRVPVAGEVAAEWPAPPAFHGDVTLTTVPGDEPLDVVAAVAGEVTFDATLTQVGTWQLALASALGSADSEAIEVTPGALSKIALTAPTEVVAGEAFAVSAEARDAFGNRVDLDGAASLVATDEDAQIPDGVVFVDGTLALGNLALQRAGATTLTLSAGAPSVSGNASIDVVAAAPSGLRVTLPDTAKAGVAAPLLIEVVDAFGNVAAFVGDVSLSEDDALVTLPTFVSFAADDAGSRTLDVVFGAIGTRTVTATRSPWSANDSTVVRAGAPVGVVLSGAAAVAGVAAPVHVAIVDAYGQVANDPADAYRGSVTFDLAGAQPSRPPALPGQTTFAAGDLSEKDVVVTWLEAGTWTLRATGSGLAEAATLPVTVSAGAFAGLDVSLPATATAGLAVDLRVSAVDVGGNAVEGFVGTVTLSDDDSGSDLPTSVDFAAVHAGTRIVPVVFATVGNRTVTATTNAVSDSATTRVGAGAPHHLVLSVDGPATTGQPLPVHVAVVDRLGNVAAPTADDPVAPYTGTITFTTAPPMPAVAPSLPGPTAFVAADLSEKDVTTTWFTAGTWQLRASGTGLSAATIPIIVEAGTANALDVALPATSKAGVASALVISARDPSGNIDPSFVGTVSLSDDDPASDLPTSIELSASDAGTRTLDVVFSLPGQRTVTADAGNLSDSATTTVRAGSPHHLVLTVSGQAATGVAKSVNVAAVDRFGNVANDPATLYLGTVTFDVTGVAPAVAPTLPGATAFLAANASQRDVLTTWKSPGTFTLRATGTALATTTATVAVTVTGSPASRFELTLPDSVKVGTPVNLVISAKDALGNVDAGFIGTVTLSDDDDASDLPATLDFAAANAGTRTIPVTFGSVGARTVTASAGALTGNDTTTVLPGPPSAIRLTTTGSATTGAPQSVHVAILDARGNIASDPADTFVGDVVFDQVESPTAPPPTLPGTVAFTAADLGEKDVAATWFRPGTWTLRATATGLTTATLPVPVAVSPATRIAIVAPASFVAGTSPNAVATAQDAWGNTDTGFAQTVTVSGVDGQIPALTFAAGTKTFALTLTSARAYTVSLDAGAAHGQHAVTVTPAAAILLHFTGSSPEDPVQHQGATLTFNVQDVYGNIATNFAGDVAVGSSDLGATYPATVTLTAADLGVGSFDITFDQTGSVRVSIFGVGLTGDSLNLTVLSASPARLSISDRQYPGPTPYVGVPYDGFDVTLKDGDGALAASDGSIAVTLRFQSENPGPARLSGTLTRTIPAGAYKVRFDDLVIDRPGYYALAGTATGLEPANGTIFSVEHRPARVQISNATVANGCVVVDYSIEQDDGVPHDLQVTYSATNVGGGSATQGGSERDIDGTFRLALGDHRFLWNAARDLGSDFHGTADISVDARASDAQRNDSYGGNLRQVALDFRPQLAVAYGGLVPASRADIAAGDIDGDGLVDAAFASGDQIELAFANGSSMLTPQSPNASFTRVAVDDIDGDGLGEVVALDAGNNVVVVYAPLSGGATETFGACGDDRVVDIASGDLDRGGQHDIAALCDGTSANGETVALWRFGAGWSEWVRVPVGSASGTALVIADLDKDGVSDLVVGSDTDIAVVRGFDPGSGNAITFSVLQTVATGSVNELAAADLDFDGLDEVIAVYANGTTVRIQGLDGLPSALLADTAELIDTTLAEDVALVDVDHDGGRDIALTAKDTGALWVGRYDWQSNDIGFFEQAPATSAGFDQLAVAGDEWLAKNRDASSSDAYALLVTTPAARCQPAIDALRPTPPWGEATVVASDDLNGEGKLDLITANRSIDVAFGRGDGSFEPDPARLYDGNDVDQVLAVATGDFNHDGLVDVAYAIDDGTIGVLARVDEPGTFAFTLLTSLVGQSGRNALRAADLDGDRYDDLVYVDGTGAIALAYQTATTANDGVFDVMTTTTTGYVADLDVGSIDNRGNLDIVYYLQDDSLPGDLRHSLCIIQTGTSVDYRHYGETNCAPLDDDLTPGERAGLDIQGLALERNSTYRKKAFYRYVPDLYTPHLEAREVGEVNFAIAGPAESIGVCGGNGPREFALGFVGVDDAVQDVVASCYAEGDPYFEVLQRFNDTPAELAQYPLDLGQSPLVSDDFDGRSSFFYGGYFDLASNRGTIDLGHEADIARTPVEVTANGLGRPAGMIGGDFTGDGLGDLFVASIFRSGSDTWLEVAVRSPYGEIEDNPIAKRICGDACDANTEWAVSLGKSDIDGDGDDDVLLLYGSLNSDGSVLEAYSVDRFGTLTLLPPLIGANGETGFDDRATLVVGDLLPGGGTRQDIVLVGLNASLPLVKVLHRGDDGALSTFVSAADSVLPSEVSVGAIGDFQPDHPGNELALAHRGDILVLGAVDCDLGPSCIDNVAAAFPVDQFNDNLRVVGIVAYQRDGAASQANDAIVTLTDANSEGGSYGELSAAEWDGTTFARTALAFQGSDLYTCAAPFDTSCSLPAIGPFVSDFDLDGKPDLLVGWRAGQTWEVLPAHDDAYLVGATSNNFGDLAAVLRLDRSTLPDIALIDRDAGRKTWVLRR